MPDCRRGDRTRPSSDSTQRFSSRVRDYVRWRPRYPEAIVDTLRAVGALSAGARVADIGSGTGISAELLLRRGCAVFAVEPNAAMREAAEQILGGHPRFQSVAGTAEATTLPAASVDLVFAAQAFHWFDPLAARSEFSRILQTHGKVALVWNTRRTEGTPFLQAYEALLHEFGTDYRQIDHRLITPARLRDFLAGEYRGFTFQNEQVLDEEGLKGRLLSSSYAPGPGDPRHEPMLRALRDLFATFQEGGRVRLVYDTELHLGS